MFLLFPQSYFSGLSHMHFFATTLNSLLFPKCPIFSPTSHLLFSLPEDPFPISPHHLLLLTLQLSVQAFPVWCREVAISLFPQYLQAFTVALSTACGDLSFTSVFLRRLKPTWRSFYLNISLFLGLARILEHSNHSLKFIK